jgi:hypothetical protein
MNDWNIQSRAHACQACGKTFGDKDTCHSVLLDERREYQRMDLCADCWKEQFSQGVQDRKGFISCWQSVYEAPPAAPPDPIQRDTAEGLLRKLIERNDPQYAPAAFILAVMLERKRILKVREQVCGEGRRIFIYEQAKTGDVFTIPDPQLQLNQLDEVQRVVADLLEHGLPSPQAELALVPGVPPEGTPSAEASPDHAQEATTMDSEGQGNGAAVNAHASPDEPTPGRAAGTEGPGMVENPAPSARNPT